MNMVRVLLGKSLRTVNLGLLMNPAFHKLCNYIGGKDVNLDEVERLIDEVNEWLKRKSLQIEIRKALPLDEKADYRLILRCK